MATEDSGISLVSDAVDSRFAQAANFLTPPNESHKRRAAPGRRIGPSAPDVGQDGEDAEEVSS